jgi:transcriptional regulator with XRE-family HTH domain
MRLHNLKRLKTLMVVQDVSQRRLATAAGYKSHAYLGRLMRGEVDTLEPEAALRIARFLQVDADFLFAARLSTDAAHFKHRHMDVHTRPLDTVAPSRDLPGASRGDSPPGSRFEGRHR